ncbi:MAG: GtrA family protein [Oscillospiraceae bacterium]
MDIKNIINKNKELLSYLFFGVLTTAVNYLSYLALTPYFSKTIIPTVIAWLLSVVFAYVTNRSFVFHSKAASAKAVTIEIFSFFGARIFSGVLDVGVMWLLVDCLSFNDKIIKLLSNVFVIIFNYVISKLLIFRKKV